MKIDLFHNQIIRNTATKKFIDCVRRELIPMLEEAFGDALLEVVMYEDHLNDDFITDGRMYYPLTLGFENGSRIQWICWDVSDAKKYPDGNPYSYYGLAPIEFSLVDKAPAAFDRRMSDRRFTCDANAMQISVEAPGTDKKFLIGKADQSFLDAMASALTVEMEKAFSVRGLADSSVSLRLTFAAESFMEHISGSVTYRRLQLFARGCSPRDFWVKWTRLDGQGAYSVTDRVSPEDIRFEIGEDVPRQMREKEYRYLAFGKDAARYQSAISSRNLTDWRELLKIALRRGEVSAVEAPKPARPAYEPVEEPVFTPITPAKPASKPAEKTAEPKQETDIMRAIRLARAALEEENRAAKAAPQPAPAEPAVPETPAPTFDLPDDRPAPEKPADSEHEMMAELRRQFEEQQAQLRKENERLAALLAKSESEKKNAEKKAEEERKAQAAQPAEPPKKPAPTPAEVKKKEAEAEESRRIEETLSESLSSSHANVRHYTYISRSAQLLFRRNVDPNITRRIHEIIAATIKFYHKEDVHIRVRASIPDQTTVVLEFLRIPEQENELLVTMLKVLGNSDLGIAKIILN